MINDIESNIGDVLIKFSEHAKHEWWVNWCTLLPLKERDTHVLSTKFYLCGTYNLIRETGFVPSIWNVRWTRSAINKKLVAKKKEYNKHNSLQIQTKHHMSHNLEQGPNPQECVCIYILICINIYIHILYVLINIYI